MEFVDFIANSQVVFVGVSFEFCVLPLCSFARFVFELGVEEGFSGFHVQLESMVIRKNAPAYSVHPRAIFN